MNIEGLSTATLETFVQRGFVSTPADLYYIEKHREQIVNLDGFGEKSYENIIKAIEKSKTTTFERYLYALGISEIGRSQSKEIKKYLQTLSDDGTLWNKFIGLLVNGFDFSSLPGFGTILNQNLYTWFNYEMNEWEEDLAAILTFTEEKAEKTEENWVTGKTFVVTGDVHHYKNRNELKSYIESCGGKVAGSVSSKTTFLINNDVTSTSGKNQKAKEFGIPIISEDEFIKNCGISA